MGEEPETLDALKRKLAARDALLAALIHDLRHPLWIVMMSGGQLASAELPPELTVYTERIKTHADRMDRLIRDFVDATRLEDGSLTLQVRPHPIADFVRKLVASLRPLAGRRKLELALTLPDPAVAVACDKQRVEQVIANLFDHAIKSTTERGRIGIELRAEDGRIRITVTDDAETAASELPRDLAVAARTRGALGLYIARALVEAQGSTLEVAGRSFGFTLPLDV